MALAREVAVKRAVTLELLTVAWMLIEAAVALGAGIAARSVLLTAFGVDSVVELLSGIVLYRRLSVESRGASTDEVDRQEHISVRISAVLLILLCAYVLLTSLAGLALRITPADSVAGIGVSAAAVVLMPLLARFKRQANRVIDSPSLRADIAETVTCAFLAGVTLVGLALSMLTGWWWVQYVAAIALLVWLVPEAREALEHWRDDEAEHVGGRE